MQQQYLSTRHQLQHQSQTQSQISNRKRTRNLGCMKIEKIVGSGTFGLVFKAIDLENNVEVALKKIKTERETQGFPITALREIKILTTLKHENIVNLREILMYDKTKDSNSYSNNGSNNNNGSSNSNDSSLIIPEGSIQDNDIFMVFEFVDYDLSGILKSNEIILTDEQVKSYTKQLLVGVHYLHSHNILHRDLKCANILITRNNVLKIADWGLARVIPAQNICLTTPVVTLWYRSPELILGNKKYGYEVDVWSVG